MKDSAVRECDLHLQQALAEQRAAEAAVEKQREFQFAQSDRVSSVQGATTKSAPSQPHRTDPSRTRANCASGSATSWRRRATCWPSSTRTSQRDERQIEQLRAEIAQLAPDLAQAQAAESGCNEGLAAAEHELAGWQERWEEFNRELGAAHQTTQVERTRIEQLEDQLRRLSAQADRLAVERER